MTSSVGNPTASIVTTARAAAQGKRRARTPPEWSSLKLFIAWAMSTMRGSYM